MLKFVRCLAVFIGLLIAAPAVSDDGELWRITFDTNWLGPMDAHVTISREDGALRGVSHSGAAALIGDLPGEHDIAGGLMVFEAAARGDGGYEGTFLAPWHEGRLTLEFGEGGLSGVVDGGAFAGTLRGQRVETAGAIRDYAALLREFDNVVAGKLFDPRGLKQPGYQEFRRTIGRVAAVAMDDLDLLFGFYLAWQQGPFSHFGLKRSHQSAAEMFAYFDNYRVGFEAATVEFDGDTAVLKVRTMMGADTIEQIRAAYASIAKANPRTLIIDLRGNEGGAFAVKPLVEHVVDEPVDAGYFVSQVWTRDHSRAPTVDEAMQAPEWHGWSIVAFWHDVQQRDILRVTFQPAEPNFDGNVFVLVDERSASATELAADALRASGVATLVGQKTAGEMLSQSMFDIGEGFVVSLPVADYYSMQHGRLEGAGVPVHVESDPDQALELARRLAAER